MAKDDYHAVVYQILSYLYIQLKAGKTADVEKLSCSGLFGINERYRLYIFENLYKEGYITGVRERKPYINESPEGKYIDLTYCEITPKGIEYLSDNSFMKKAMEFFKDVKNIIPLV